MQQSNKIIKGLKVGVQVLFYIIIGALLLFSIATLTQKRKDQIPNLFGFGFLSVASDSMDGDQKNSFKTGDLVLVKVLNKNQRANLNFDKMTEKGTIVSFYDYNLKAINTHRVVDNGTLANGEEYVQTQGDKEGLDPDEFLLERKDIVATYRGKIKGFGKAIAFTQTQIGFAVVVIVPMLLLLFWQGYILISDIYTVKSEQLKEDLEKEREEERERIRQELLEEMENKEE